jgi:hypothetical protein
MAQEEIRSVTREITGQIRRFMSGGEEKVLDLILRRSLRNALECFSFLFKLLF